MVLVAAQSRDETEGGPHDRTQPDGRGKLASWAMSDDDDDKWDAVAGLRAFHHRLSGEVRGEYGGRARTAFVRIAVLVVGLAFGGPILWAALWSMPTPLAVFIGLAIAFRVGRWFWRRYYRR
jgi:hypothetical protein